MMAESKEGNHFLSFINLKLKNKAFHDWTLLMPASSFFKGL